MEEVLDLYAEPYDPARPVVCFDEMPVQLIGETRPPLPTAPGRPACRDYEYVRHGTCNVFVAVEPLRGRRQLTVTARRTRADFARQMQWLVDVAYPDATTIRVVLDNLNTHTAAALYDTLPPAEARRLLRKLEFHYTPPHGSWLNMAEIEFSVVQRQCLARRIADPTTLQQELAAYARQRNTTRATITWQFTVDNARVKLHRLYPSLPS